MGFFRKFFSLGRKSNGKKLTTPSYNDLTIPALPPNDIGLRVDEEQNLEAAESRLLRSSSAHFTIVSEVDYTELPPIRELHCLVNVRTYSL